ncbi:MAG: T9SS type A sorting domain-containing protein [Bacteroidetes bacterium]|nr:T9SS type A sorting domain-containing protein [Bacteroidota bacterium]
MYQKVYGCTDSFALNYDPKANVDNGSCKYKLSSIAQINGRVLLYPNPSKDILSVTTMEDMVSADIINELGQIVFHQALSTPQRKWEIKVAGLPASVYTLKLKMINGHSEQTQFIIE